MGMSVSASAAIVLIGAILILSLIYPALQVSDKVVNQARQEWLNTKMKEQESSMEIINGSYNSTSERLNITVKNSGSTTLHVNKVDVLINGTYRTDRINLSSSSVDENTDTNLWMAETILNLTLDDINISTPIRIKIVNEYGKCAYYRYS